MKVENLLGMVNTIIILIIPPASYLDHRAFGHTWHYYIFICIWEAAIFTMGVWLTYFVLKNKVFIEGKNEQTRNASNICKT